MEEFRKRLERLTNTEGKNKIKPNISNDWLKELRRRLNSVSTDENSVERTKMETSYKGSHSKQARAMATI